MASVRERTTKAGQRTWSVLYREGGKQRSTTFDNPKSAIRLVQLMDTLGVDRGLATFAEEALARARGVTVDELAEQWFGYKARDLTPRALSDYRRPWASAPKR